MNSKHLLSLAACAALAGCGGSSSSTPSATTPGPATSSEPVIAQGTLSGFGSVIVNGVRYDTSGAVFTIDDDVGSESDLAVGQVITVKGSINSDGATGTASSVTFDDLVEGPIEFIDATTNTMVVLGQLVLIDDGTSFEDDIQPGSLEGLAVGNIVEVSGYLDADGNILATHVELEDVFDEYEVTGFARTVDNGSFTLEIGRLVVDYSSATLDDFPTPEPLNGQLVEAEGVSLGPSGELIAMSLEFEGNDMDADDGDEAEIEGLITRFGSATDFDVNGTPVTTTAATTYENGSSADLALNLRVEVEGEFDANGVLVADKVEFEQDGVLRIEAPLEAIEGQQLTVLGIAVTVTMETEFEDNSVIDDSRFDLSDLRVGDYLEIRGYDDGGFIATRIERDDDEGEVALRGFVESVSQPEFSILGVTIRTGPGTEFEDEDVLIDADSFFGNALGRLVEAEGMLENGVIVADEVEFEHEND